MLCITDTSSEKGTKTDGNARKQSEKGTPTKGGARHLSTDSCRLLHSAKSGNIADNDFVFDTISGDRVCQDRSQAKVAFISQIIQKEGRG